MSSLSFNYMRSVPYLKSSNGYPVQRNEKIVRRIQFVKFYVTGETSSLDQESLSVETHNPLLLTLPLLTLSLSETTDSHFYAF